MWFIWNLCIPPRQRSVFPSLLVTIWLHEWEQYSQAHVIRHLISTWPHGATLVQGVIWHAGVWVSPQRFHSSFLIYPRDLLDLWEMSSLTCSSVTSYIALMAPCNKAHISMHTLDLARPLRYFCNQKSRIFHCISSISDANTRIFHLFLLIFNRDAGGRS